MVSFSFLGGNEKTIKVYTRERSSAATRVAVFVVQRTSDFLLGFCFGFGSCTHEEVVSRLSRFDNLKGRGIDVVFEAGVVRGFHVEAVFKSLQHFDLQFIEFFDGETTNTSVKSVLLEVVIAKFGAQDDRGE